MLAILDSAGLSHTSNFWRQRQERPQGRLLENWIVFKIYGRLGSGKDVAGISKSYLSESHNDRSELRENPSLQVSVLSTPSLSGEEACHWGTLTTIDKVENGVWAGGPLASKKGLAESRD